jgi:enterobacterial common antigen flippase
MEVIRLFRKRPKEGATANRCASRCGAGHGYKASESTPWGTVAKVAVQERFSFVRAKLRLIYVGGDNFGALLQTMTTRTSIFAFNVGCGVLTARGLGAEGRGILAALITWPQFLAYLLTFGLVNSFIFNVKSDPHGKDRYFGAVIVLALLAGAVATALGVALMPRLLGEYSDADVRLAQYLMTAAPAVLLALAVQSAAEAASDFRGANVLRGTSVAATFLCLLALCATGRLSPLTAAASYLVPQIPMTIWLIVRLARCYRPRLTGFAATAWQLAGYGLRCYPHEFITGAAAYVGQVVVVTRVEPAAVGWYTVSLSIARLLEIFYATVSSVLLPATAARSAAEVVEKTARAARLTALLMTVFMAPLFLSLPWLLPRIYGTEFAEAVPVARLLLLEGVLSGTVWVLMQAFLALGRPGLAALLQASAVSASAALLFLLLPWCGVVGAAAILLSVAVGKLTLAFALYRMALGSPAHVLSFQRADFAYLGALLRR